MGTISRALDRAAWLANRTLQEISDEFRERRLALALSQAHVAAACRISRPYYGRIDSGKARSLSLVEVHRIAAVLGMSTSVRLYPDGVPVRDLAHATRLTRFLTLAGPPLTYRSEVPLASIEGRPERRAWDAVVFNGSPPDGCRRRGSSSSRPRVRQVWQVMWRHAPPRRPRRPRRGCRRRCPRCR